MTIHLRPISRAASSETATAAACVHKTPQRICCCSQRPNVACRERSLHQASSSEQITSGCAQKVSRQSRTRGLPCRTRGKHGTSARCRPRRAAAGAGVRQAQGRNKHSAYTASHKPLFRIIPHIPMSEPSEAPAHIRASSAQGSNLLALQGDMT